MACGNTDDKCNTSAMHLQMQVADLGWLLAPHMVPQVLQGVIPEHWDVAQKEKEIPYFHFIRRTWL